MSEVYYKKILREEYNKKRLGDFNYSLKSFSEDCGLPPNRMSDILNGRYGISKEVSESICDKLAILGKKKELFSLSAESEHARSKIAREEAKKAFLSLINGPDRVITQEEFDVIYDLKTVALLELMRHPDFKNNLNWLSERIGVELKDIESSINRMVRVGCIIKGETGYEVNSHFFATGSKAPSKTIQSYHKSALERAKKAVEEKSVEERDFSSITFLCDPEKMNEVREKIKKFRFELANEYNTVSEGSRLHMCNIQFFDIEK